LQDRQVTERCKADAPDKGARKIRASPCLAQRASPGFEVGDDLIIKGIFTSGIFLST
jgi:hypothetical protein